jgi:hypothetical protein
MEAKNTKDILKISADIGHYIADAHVPLHSCSNYNGQKTGQEGIHALWETRIPQLFLDSFDTYSGTVEYLEKPADHIWNIISESFQGVDSVLHYQRVAESLHASDMYSYEVIANKNQRVFSEAFCADYHRLMNAMVERRMRSAIYSVAAFWYTAWVNAGQPELSGTADPGETPPDESLLKKGEIKGRKEE